MPLLAKAIIISCLHACLMAKLARHICLAITLLLHVLLLFSYPVFQLLVCLTLSCAVVVAPTAAGKQGTRFFASP